MSKYEVDPSMIARIGDRLVDLGQLAKDAEYPWPWLLPHFAILLDHYLRVIPDDAYFGPAECMGRAASWFIDRIAEIFQDYEDAEESGELPPPQPLPARKRKTPIHPELRRAVYDRDDYRCVKCGERFGISCDHIMPESKGGPTAFENLQTLCMPCNIKKGVTIEAPVFTEEEGTDGQA